MFLKVVGAGEGGGGRHSVSVSKPTPLLFLFPLGCPEPGLVQRPVSWAGWPARPQADRAACCCWKVEGGGGGRLSEDSDKSDSTHECQGWGAHRDPQTPIIGSLPWDRVDTFPGEGYLQGEPRWESRVVTELGRR